MSTDKTNSDNRAEPIRTTLGLLPVIALSATLTGPAQAQENNVVLGEINVEGQQAGSAGSYKADRLQSRKATAPLVNTPQTVTVVPERVIEERGATDLIEVLRNTPGISIDAGENGFTSSGTSIFIRGMNASGNVFTDGSRDNGSQRRDTFNVEQVEVVKGASSTNGRGGGGGFVNMATKTPTLDDFVRASTRLGFDDDGRTRARGTVDVNKSVDNFAFRFNGMAEGGKMFGRELSDENSWGIAPSLAYGLGTDFRAIFAYEHVNRSGLPDSGVLFNRNAGELTRNAVAIPGAGPRDTVGDFLPRDAFFGIPDGYDKAKSDAVLARLEYDINDTTTISNQTRWSRVDRDANYGFAGSSSPYLLDRVNNTLTNQTNLTARFDTGSLSHTLSTGLEFSREEADTVRGGNDANLSGVKIDTVAGYLYDTIEFNEQWLVNGGVRVERYSVDIEATNGDIPGVVGTSFSDSKTTVSGNLGVVYKPTPDGSIYASYGISSMPHGSLLSNPDPSRTGNNGFPGFVAGAKPVEAHNVELGVKWDFLGGDLSLTGAVFHTEKRNVAFKGAAGDPEIVYGKQQIQGVELGAAGKITSSWSVFGGVTLLNSKRKHGEEVDRALAGDYGASGVVVPGFTGVTTTNGDELAFTPKITASVWSTYDINEKWTLGGGFQYVGSSHIGRPDDATRVIPNGKFGKLPSYFLVNLMASYNITDNVTVRFNVDNVFNEKYLTTANWNGNWGYLGAPRTYRIGTSFRF